MSSKAHYSKVELTEEQQEVYDRFKEALRDCERADIYLHKDEFGNLTAFNGAAIFGTTYKGRSRRNIGEYFEINYVPLDENGNVPKSFMSMYVPCFSSENEGEHDVFLLNTEDRHNKYLVCKGIEDFTDDPYHPGWRRLVDIDSLQELRDYLRDYFGTDDWTDSPEGITMGLRYGNVCIFVYRDNSDEVLMIREESVND